MKKLIFFSLMLSYNFYSIAQRKVNPTMDQLMGVNARQELTDNVSKLDKFDNIRFFHWWSDDVGFASLDSIAKKNYNKSFDEKTKATSMKYRLNYTLNANIKYNEFDKFYTSFSKRIFPVLTTISPLMRGYDQNKNLDTNQIKAANAANPNNISFNLEILQQKPIDLTQDNIYSYEGESNTPTVGTVEPNKPNTLLLNAYMPPSDVQSTPSSYISQAKRMTLFATKFGNKRMQDPCYQYYKNSYTIGTNGERLPDERGLKALTYYECYNETDKTWLDYGETKDKNGNWEASPKLGTDFSWFQMSAPQVGAMMSASFDGHGSSSDFRITTPSTELPGCEYLYLGIKNSDPTAKVILPGVAEFRGKYVYDIVDWCLKNRKPGINGFLDKNPNTQVPSQQLPFDVINFHHYSTNKSTLGSNGYVSNDQLRKDVNFLKTKDYSGDRGACPEEDDLSGDINYCLNVGVTAGGTTVQNPTIINAIKDIPVWITEFGYDSKNLEADNSFTGVSGATVKERRLKQAQWIMRSFLQIANTNQIDRAYMYEAADNAYSGVFQTSGLFTENYKEKKESYYFYQTLKNVLSGYSHDEKNTGLNASNLGLSNYKQIHSDIDEAKMISSVAGTLDKNKIFCYKFKNGTKTIYAVWSGTPDNRSGTIDLPIYWGMSSSGVSVLQITSATIITPTILDENGVSAPHTNIAQSGNLSILRELNISETPIFILANEILTETRPNNITNLKADPSCCGSVKLSWTIPTTNIPCKYHIYYAKDASTITTLDLSKLTLYNDNIPGAATSSTITLLDSGKYTFWVIPFNCTGDPVSDPLKDDFKDVYQKVTIDVNSSGCTNCFATPTITYSYQDISGSWFDNKKLFELGSTKCTDLFSEARNKELCNDPFNWLDWIKPGNIPTGAKPFYIIDFGQPVIIPAMYYFSGGDGFGNISFQFMKCDEDCWESSTNLSIRPVQCNNDKNWNIFKDGWKSIANFRNTPVRKIKVTKENDEAKIKKIFFCTEPAKCPRTQRIQELPASDLNFNFVGETNVGLSFKTATNKDLESGTIEVENNYEIQVSSQWENEELVNPITIPLGLANFSATSDVVISDLLPNTTYKVKIVPYIDQTPYCAVKKRLPLLGTFTTKGTEVNTVVLARKANSGKIPMILPEMLIYPNPTSGEFNISLPYAGYTQLEVMNMNGQVIQSKSQDSNSRNGIIDIHELPSGIYFVKAIGNNLPYITNKISKQ
jgi:Secretion system C-terminal sorting domain